MRGGVVAPETAKVLGDGLPPVGLGGYQAGGGANVSSPATFFIAGRGQLEGGPGGEGWRVS